MSPEKIGHLVSVGTEGPEKCETRAESGGMANRQERRRIYSSFCPIYEHTATEGGRGLTGEQAYSFNTCGAARCRVCRIAVVPLLPRSGGLTAGGGPYS